MDDNENTSTIIGIDFGSTSSAAAFIRPNSRTKEIQALHYWPSALKWSFDQVPRGAEIQSIVYYDPRIQVVGWSGNRDEVVTAQGNLKPGIQATPSFKAQLFPPTDEFRNGLLPPGKTVEGITVDFLSHFRRSVLEQPELAGWDCKGSFEFVMTVPAFWSDETRGEFGKITKMAGFDQVELVSSHEAALFNAHFTRPSCFNQGDNILVLDCGGHLVEGSTYHVKSTSPLSIDRRTSVSVASCGSAEVSRQFMAIAGSKIDKTRFPAHGRTKPRMRLRAKRAFEKDLLFGDTLGRPGHKFELPPEMSDGFWVADLGVEMNCPEADLVEGYMVFSEDEVYSCFDAVVERTLGLVREQVQAMQEHNAQIQVRTKILVSVHMLTAAGLPACWWVQQMPLLQPQSEVRYIGVRNYNH